MPAASGIARFADLRGKSVALPHRADTSLEYGWGVLLRLHGMTLAELGTKNHGSFVENVERLKNRQALATGWLVGVPAPFVLDLGSTLRLRMLPVEDDVPEKMRRINGGFVRYVIPKGTYAAQGIEEDVVTKAVVEGRRAFAPVTSAMKGLSAADMAESFGMPYHPGAARYYRETGLLK